MTCYCRSKLCWLPTRTRNTKRRLVCSRITPLPPEKAMGRGAKPQRQAEIATSHQRGGASLTCSLISSQQPSGTRRPNQLADLASVTSAGPTAAVTGCAIAATMGCAPDPAAACTGVAERRFCSKQDRHSTGRPCVGRKGTVVSCPHTEQCVRVSARTLEPPPRFSLHALHRFGSL